MNNIFKPILTALFAAALTAGLIHISGSILFSLSALTLSLFLYTYNRISAIDTLPDSDYLITGEGPITAAAVYTAFFLTSSLIISALSAFFIATIYLLFFKSVVSPGGNESPFAGLIISAAVWLPLVLFIPQPESMFNSVTGFSFSGLLSIYLIIFSAAAGVLLIAVLKLYEEELKLTGHGNTDLLFNNRKYFMIKSASLIIRSFSSALTVIFGGLLFSFGYALRCFGLKNQPVHLMIIFFCIVQIFFLAVYTSSEPITVAGFFLILSLLLYFAAFIKSKEKPYD